MFHRPMMKFVVMSALLTSFMGPLAAVAAIHEQSDSPPKRVVKFADLDLTRSEGAAVLYSRIGVAAREVCELQIAQLSTRSQTYECRRMAIARAITDVGSATLTMYYQMKTAFGIGDSQQH